jgi:hypothetical protein
MCNRIRILKVFATVLGFFTCTASALAGDDRRDGNDRRAGDGGVLPDSAKPKGYSLSDIAAATAAYNIDQSTPPPNVPFEILVGDTTVKSDTMFYLPIFFADDSPPVAPGFPAHIRDQDADADYLYSLAGVDAFIVQVDDKLTILDDDYVRGVKTAPLSDGGGTHYIVSAAFLTPLTPGKHTVGIGGIVDMGTDDDEPVVFVSYNVTVR